MCESVTCDWLIMLASNIEFRKEEKRKYKENEKILEKTWVQALQLWHKAVNKLEGTTYYQRSYTIENYLYEF